MGVDPDHDAVFNEVYDAEHVPALLGVPGVRSAVRYRAVPFAMVIGGTRLEVAPPAAGYVVVYEIDSPDVVTSPEWVAAVESGRWPAEVRPHTRDRNHMVLAPIDDFTEPDEIANEPADAAG